MLAVHALSATAQAWLYFIALVAFLVGAVLSVRAKAHPTVLLFVGLAAVDLVWFWNALAQS